MNEAINLLKEIDAWLSFNNNPSREQIAEFRKDLRSKLQALTEKQEGELPEEVKAIPTTDETNEFDLREMAHYYGGWDELRKLIAELEEQDNEAAWERSQGYEGDGNFADNH